MSASVEVDHHRAPTERQAQRVQPERSYHPSRRAIVLTALTVAAIVLCYLWLALPQLRRPYVYDDVNFALGARAVAQTGLPFGNQGYLLHLVEQREQWALWHPPLYLFTLGLWMRLFGDGEVATRSLSVLCLLLAAGLAFDLARRIVADDGDRIGGLAAGTIAVALLLLNPLAIQSGQVLDIDNTVLMLLLALYARVALRLPGHWDGRTILALAALYALTLWAKLTTPLVLLAALAFTRLFQGLGVRGALEALAAGALGWVLFFVTWSAVNLATGMPWDYTLTVVYREAIESSASSGHRLASVPAFVNGVAPALLWIGPFFCLLFVLAGLPRLRSLLSGRGLVASDLLLVLGAAIYLAYFAKLAASFPKYHMPMLPLWAAVCGVLVARAAGRPSPVQATLAVGATVGLTAWLVGPMAADWTILWTRPLAERLIGVPLAVGAAVTVLWALLGRRNRLGAMPVALLVLTLSWSLALDLAQRELVGSTTYFYGRHGQREAAEALDRILRPDEPYVAAKEVAWYAANQHYVDQESWQHVVVEAGERFDGTYLGLDIRVVAIGLIERAHRAGYDQVLLPRYRPAAEHGSFVIYVRAN